MRSLLKSDPADAQRRLKPPDSPDEAAQFERADAQPADHESYTGLLDLSPPQRTHRLARLLHWDRALGDATAATLTLDQCLARASPAARLRTIEAFWVAREQAARCQAVSDQNDQLTALYPAVLRSARRPGGAEAMLDLRARQQAVAADLLEEQARLLERRLELATLCRQDSQSKDWPLPSTPPHGGRYELKLDAQSPQFVQSRSVRSLATAVPGLYAALEDRAEAVVRLDGQRAAAAEGLETDERFASDAAKRADLTAPLELIERQATESLAFLSTLTRYNVAIAEYVLTVLPSGISPVELTGAMVVKTP
jgi:hypothetical protein